MAATRIDRPCLHRPATRRRRRAGATSLVVAMLLGASATSQTTPAPTGPQGALDAVSEVVGVAPVAVDGRGRAVFDVDDCAAELRQAVTDGVQTAGRWSFVGFARLAAGGYVATLTDADGRLWSIRLDAQPGRCVATPDNVGHVIDAASWEVVLPPVVLERIGPVDLP